jgi:hypothetical protein
MRFARFGRHGKSDCEPAAFSAHELAKPGPSVCDDSSAAAAIATASAQVRAASLARTRLHFELFEERTSIKEPGTSPSDSGALPRDRGAEAGLTWSSRSGC